MLITICSAVKDYSQKYLAQNSYGPFGTLKSHMAYISTMLYKTPSAPKIVWSPDYTVVTYQDMSLDLSRLRSGLKKLLSELEEEIAYLTGGIEADIPSDFHLENLANGSRGFSFLGLPQFANQYKQVLRHLMEPDFEYCVAKLNPFGKLDWNQQHCIKVMEHLESIIKKIAVVAYIIPSQPPRGTEYCQWRLSNQDLMRNVFYLYGICFVNMQLKTTNLKEALDFIPMFCPPCLSRILCNYLILLRGIEITLSQQITHLAKANCAATYQEYFLVSMGKHMDSDAFGHIFADITFIYFGVRLTKRPYRHMSVATKREYISPVFHSFLLEDDVGDQAAGHGSFEATRTYARVQGDLPFLTTDRIYQFRKFSEAWHNVLHLGAEMPPEPISIRKSRQWAALNNNISQSTSMDCTRSNPINASPSSLHQEEADHLIVVDQQPIKISQQMMDQICTAVENRVKTSVQAILTEELADLKTAIQDVTKSITNIHTTYPNSIASQHTGSSSHDNYPISPLAQHQIYRRSSDELSTQLSIPPTPELSSSGNPTPFSSYTAQIPTVSHRPTSPLQIASKPIVPKESMTSSQSQLPSTSSYSLPLSSPLLAAEPYDELEYATSRVQTPADYALKLLQKALDDPNATFRSPAQEEMVRRALDCSESFICIIPTGGGKSALWNAPVYDSRESSMTTIVLEPFLSLIADQLHHLTSTGVKACMWKAQMVNNSDAYLGNYRVIFASFESMGTIPFKS